MEGAHGKEVTVDLLPASSRITEHICLILYPLEHILSQGSFAQHFQVLEYILALVMPDVLAHPCGILVHGVATLQPVLSSFGHTRSLFDTYQDRGAASSLVA
jgi:hypothetical protein